MLNNVPERITDNYVKHQPWVRPNLDISHRCILRCPQCIRQKLSSQDQIRRSFDLEEKDFQKIINYYHNIGFCGQISDPIYHPNFLKFLEMSEGKKVRIATNGSGQSLDWWQEAYSYGVGENAWYFGVDGIDEKSELYRVGSNFENVWDMMKLGRDLGHAVVWQYIIFDFNQDDTEKALEIAKKEDFTLLFVHTNRSFRGDNFLLRKNVNPEFAKPLDKFIQDRIKKEWYAHKTEAVENWKRLK